MHTRQVDEIEAFPLFEQHRKDRVGDGRAPADKEARQQRRSGGGQRADEGNSDLRKGEGDRGMRRHIWWHQTMTMNDTAEQSVQILN